MHRQMMEGPLQADKGISTKAGQGISARTLEIDRQRGFTAVITTLQISNATTEAIDFTILPNSNVKATRWNGYRWVDQMSLIESGSNHISISGDGTRIAIRRFQPNLVMVYDLSSRHDIGLVGTPLVDDSAGASVAISTDGLQLAVSSEKHNNGAGKVDIFRYSDNEDWVLFGSIAGSKEHALFGWATAFSASGERLVVSSVLDSCVTVFQRGRTWAPIGSQMTSEEKGDQFGFSVDISTDGMIVAVGSHGVVGIVPGVVTVYRLKGNQWIKWGEVVKGNKQDVRFGKRVMLANNGFRLFVLGTHTMAFDWRNDRFEEIPLPLSAALKETMVDLSMTYDGSTLVALTADCNLSTEPLLAQTHSLSPVVSGEYMGYPIASPSRNPSAAPVETQVSSVEKFRVEIEACICDGQECLGRTKIETFQNIFQFCLSLEKTGYYIGLVRSLFSVHGTTKITYMENFRRMSSSPLSGENYPFDDKSGLVSVKIELGLDDNWAFFRRSWRAIRYPQLRVFGMATVMSTSGEVQHFDIPFDVEASLQEFQLVPFLRQNDTLGWSLRVVLAIICFLGSLRVVPLIIRQGWLVCKRITLFAWTFFEANLAKKYGNESACLVHG